MWPIKILYDSIRTTFIYIFIYSVQEINYVVVLCWMIDLGGYHFNNKVEKEVSLVIIFWNAQKLSADFFAFPCYKINSLAWKPWICLPKILQAELLQGLFWLEFVTTSLWSNLIDKPVWICDDLNTEYLAIFHKIFLETLRSKTKWKCTFGKH